MEIRARLSAVSGKAASSADAPNKVSFKLLNIQLDRAPPSRTPLEEAIDGAR